MLASALGALIGALLGLTGAGGGILAVPALTLVLGWSMTQASPIALLAVASAATAGLIDGFKKRLVRYRAAALISITGIAATPIGQYLALRLPEKWLAVIFATVMIIVAWRLWHSAAARTASDDGIDSKATRARRIQLDTGRIAWNVTSFMTLSIIGILTGLTTGLLGVGGGFIIVPALLRCSNITLDGIVATSLMVIALVSSGAIISAWASGHIELSASAGLFILGATFGMLLGRQFAHKLPKQHVLRLLSALIIGISLLLLYSKLF
jgi:uncharacterized membrane protein YfcA